MDSIEKEIGRGIRMGMVALALGAGLTGGCQKPSEGTSSPTPERTPTVTTDFPPRPTIEMRTPTPTELLTPTETPTPEAIPASVMEWGVSEVGTGGESDILKMFDIVPSSVAKKLVEEKNKGMGIVLLTPEGTGEQNFVKLQINGKTLALGNWNAPIYPEGSGSVIFNNPEEMTVDFQNLFGFEDKDHNLFFHIPIQELRIWEEGKVPIVFMKDGVLKSGLVEEEAGLIDQTSIKDYWTKMPEGAVEAVMARFGNAIYVTFYDEDGNQLVDERITVCDLPE